MQTLSPAEQYRAILAPYNTEIRLHGAIYKQETTAMVLFWVRLTISVTIKNKNGVPLGRLELRENSDHTEFNVFVIMPFNHNRAIPISESEISLNILNYLHNIAQPLAAVSDAKLQEVHNE